MPVLLRKIGRLFLFTILVDFAGIFTLVLFVLARGGTLSQALYVGFMLVPDFFFPALFALLFFILIRAKTKLESHAGTLALRAALLAVLYLLALYTWAALEIVYSGLMPLEPASLRNYFNEEFGAYLPVMVVWAILIPLLERVIARGPDPAP